VRLSPKETAYALWALEELLLSEIEPEETEALLSLIDRLQALQPFSPFSSASQWRGSSSSSFSFS